MPTNAHHDLVNNPTLTLKPGDDVSEWLDIYKLYANSYGWDGPKQKARLVQYLHPDYVRPVSAAIASKNWDQSQAWLLTDFSSESPTERLAKLDRMLTGKSSYMLPNEDPMSYKVRFEELVRRYNVAVDLYSSQPASPPAVNVQNGPILRGDTDAAETKISRVQFVSKFLARLNQRFLRCTNKEFDSTADISDIVRFMKKDLSAETKYLARFGVGGPVATVTRPPPRLQHPRHPPYPLLTLTVYPLRCPAPFLPH